MSPQTKNCQNCKNDFIIEPEDFEFYAKIEVPPPTWCPQCRMQRRMVWRIGTSLHRRPDSRTSKTIFSSFSAKVPFPVWELEDWNSDLFDGTDYGRDYDWDKPFFEQFRDLLQVVPQPSRNILNLVRSDYTDNATSIEDCYLIFAAFQNRNCAYGYTVLYSNDSFDITHASNLDLCYEDLSCKSSYRTLYSINCQNARDSYFCKDSIEISDCFGCIGLRKKQYCIFNVQYSKEEYFERIKSFNLQSYSGVENARTLAREHFLNYPLRYASTLRTVNSSGEYLTNTKDVRKSFQISDGENIKYSQHLTMPTKDSYDYSNWGDNAELIYECAGVGHDISRIKFSHHCFPACKDLEYAINCRNSSDLFGCIGIKKKQYCILNKQYSKEEYETLLPKIKSHMMEAPFTDTQGRIYRYGEYFPPSFAPHGYNTTIAYPYFPLLKAAALTAGFDWEVPEAKSYQTTIHAADLPDSISDIPESIVGEVIRCAHEETCADNCSGAFRILKNELAFYRQLQIPVPRLCFSCRFARRNQDFSKPIFYTRPCQCAGARSLNSVYQNTARHGHHGEAACPNTFETSYSPERPEIVYCEQCYQQEFI